MEHQEEKEISMLEALLDPNNNDLIRLYDEDGEETVFRQVAVTSIEDAVYAILKPEEPFEGLGEDEALVFALEKNDSGDASLLLVSDSDIIDAVFEDYYNLLRESGIEI